MKIGLTLSIVALALSSVGPQGAMAAPRQAGPSMSNGAAAPSAATRGSSTTPGGATGGDVGNPSGNSLINTSPSGSTLFPNNTTTGSGNARR
jgi:hypothetical protein